MPHTILTVDDSPSVRQMVAFALRSENYTVVEAGSGPEALGKIAQQPINCMITDLNMPGMDGFELIRHVRALPACKFVPILMLTTENSPERKAAAKAAGATGWIVKPFTPDQLVATLRKVLV